MDAEGIMMSKFIVRGGNKLTGSVKVSGAKIQFFRSSLPLFLGKKE